MSAKKSYYNYSLYRSIVASPYTGLPRCFHISPYAFGFVKEIGRVGGDIQLLKPLFWQY